ncbi:MAG: hypothetical protein N2111_07475 [Candidatus Sumerlaeaceae bacterium]|nr:hypothetical protein [Candidatus Sumerlaeaceae bacterium]
MAAVPMKTARQIAFLGTIAFVAQNLEGMTALDVSQPRNPRMVRHFGPSEIQPLHICPLTPDTLLIADRFRGLVVWRVKGADDITSVASLRLPGMLCHLETFTTGGRTFAAVASGGEGLSIVEITDLTAPSLTARFLHNADFTRQVAVRGRHAIVADNKDGGMKIVDVADPAAPVLLFRVLLPGFCDALALQNDLLFAAYRNYGTRIFRILTPANAADEILTSQSVELLSQVVRSTDRVRNVLPLGRLLVLANDSAGVEWYDCSNPSLPVLIAEWRAPDDVMSVAERDGLLYVAAWNAGVRVIEPARPGMSRELLRH